MSITVFEFSQLPDSNGDLPYPADVDTTVVSGGTVNLSDRTTYVVICADADCRIGFNKAATSSSMPVLGPVSNPFKINPGRSRTVQFL